jgi:acyl-CoA thioesterase-1
MSPSLRIDTTATATRALTALLAAALMACHGAPPSPAPAPVATSATSTTAAEQAAARQRAADDRLRNDWANLARYRDANAKLGPPAAGENRVVFYGNSITDAWARWFPEMFPGKPYVGRGISGQTTPQMLVRFRQDVVA